MQETCFNIELLNLLQTRAALDVGSACPIATMLACLLQRAPLNIINATDGRQVSAMLARLLQRAPLNTIKTRDEKQVSAMLGADAQNYLGHLSVQLLP